MDLDTPKKRGRAGRSFSRETREQLRARILRIVRILERSRPHAAVELHHRSAWELLVATILSAQCTDQRVNQVTPTLFRRYAGPAAYAETDQAELEELIKSTGFYKSKAKHVTACAQAIVGRHGGHVPKTMEELTALPGVGRKTANVILGHWFGEPAVVVDTHVKRVAARLGLTTATDPDRIETDLQRLLPPKDWTTGSQQLLLHGRYICLARRPLCERCPIYDDCPWKGKSAR
ncbi:MAG TPA: endonuclease III [Nitrospiraceae bacterium]|nr:endonuclease III [Nitrospiraceae bacterium]